MKQIKPSRWSFIRTAFCALALALCSTGAFAATWTVYKPTASISYTSYIKVTWPKSYGATYYYIYRSTSSSWYSASLLKRVSSSVTTLYDYGVSKNRKYYYWICPGNARNYSYNTSKYDWGQLKNTTPVIPYITASDNTYKGYVKLTWPAVSGATSYQIYRSTSASYSTATRVWTGSARTVYDKSASLGYKYYYWVRAKVNGVWYYNSARYDSGYRRFTLSVSTATTSTRLYVKASVNGLWFSKPWSITYNTGLNFYWYLHNPYICYFTGKRKGTYQYTVKFGKSVTASVKRTLKVK